jgi:hypothetical protein
MYPSFSPTSVLCLYHMIFVVQFVKGVNIALLLLLVVLLVEEKESNFCSAFVVSKGYVVHRFMGRDSSFFYKSTQSADCVANLLLFSPCVSLY